MKAQADLVAADATLERAEVNVAVARADLAVARSEAKRLEAWVGYLKLLAPYDGIIVARNANTWDFVLPTSGDPTAMDRAPDLSPSRQAAPIYVVDRTDIVRIYVDVPERDANYIHIGSEARVKVWAYRDEWLQATVTRIAWALNTHSRTMRAEIDLPNPGSQILPGMYAYGEVDVQRPAVRRCRNRPSPSPAASPSSGGTWKACAIRTEIQTGPSDGQWIAVTNRRVKTEALLKEKWVPIETSDQVLIGSKLSILTDGGPVRLDKSPAPIAAGSEETSSDQAGGG